MEPSHLFSGANFDLIGNGQNDPGAFKDGSPRGSNSPQIEGFVSAPSLPSIEIGSASIQIGDQVVLLGKNGLATIRAEELATYAGTIPYEIVTGINPQIPRFLSK